jgi:hypothetical protein
VSPCAATRTAEPASETRAEPAKVLFGTIAHGARLREGDPAVHLRKNGLSY